MHTSVFGKYSIASQHFLLQSQSSLRLAKQFTGLCFLLIVSILHYRFFFQPHNGCLDFHCANCKPHLDKLQTHTNKERGEICCSGKYLSGS